MVFNDNILDREHDKFKDVGGEPAVRVSIVEGGGGGGGGGADPTYLADGVSNGRASESQLVSGMHNASLVTYNDGDQIPLQTDNKGQLLTASHFPATAGTGSSAAHTNLIGGKYEDNPTVWANRDQPWLAMDEIGRAKVFARSEKFEDQGYTDPAQETAMHIGGFGEDNRFNLVRVGDDGSLQINGSVGISNQIHGYSDNTIVSPTSTQTINSNIMQTTSNNPAAIDTAYYKSMAIAFTAAASTTAVTVQFEGSNDNINFVSLNLFDRATPLNPPVVSYAVVAGTTRYFEGAVYYRYVRARNTTAIVAGSMKVTTRFSSEVFVPSHQSIGTINSVAAVGTVTSITGANLANSTSTVIGASAITTNTTTAGVQIGNFACFQFYLNVTAVSGTNPTYDVKIQQSSNNTNWVDFYTFPTITSAGYHTTPMLLREFTHYRVVQTVGGTTPSFTRNMVIATGQVTVARFFSFLDKTINPNATSNTPTYQVEGTRMITVTQSSSAGATVNPVLTLQVSEDGTNWIDTPCTLTCAPSTNTSNYIDIEAGHRYARLATTTAGTGAVLKFVTIKAKE